MDTNDRQTRYSPLLTLAAFAAGIGLAAWLYVPLLYFLSVAGLRALFPWFTWYGNYWELAKGLVLTAMWLPVPFCALATALLLRRLVAYAVPVWRERRAAAERSSTWVRVIKIVIGLLFAPSAVALVALLGLVLVSHGPGFFVAPGGGLQRERCSACHSPYRPFHFLKPPEQWRVTVRRMRTLEGAAISAEEEIRIAEYLIATGCLSDAWYFRARCLRCHDDDQIRDRAWTAEEGRLIVERAARHLPYAFRTDWRAQIERHFGEQLAVPPPEAGTPEAEQYQRRLAFGQNCGRCHELNLVLLPDNTVRGRDGVSRHLEEKAPGQVDAGTVTAIAGFLQGAPTEPKRFDAMFPHDRPVEVPW